MYRQLSLLFGRLDLSHDLVPSIFLLSLLLDDSLRQGPNILGHCDLPLDKLTPKSLLSLFLLSIEPLNEVFGLTLFTIQAINSLLSLFVKRIVGYILVWWHVLARTTFHHRWPLAGQCSLLGFLKLGVDLFFDFFSASGLELFVSKVFVFLAKGFDVGCRSGFCLF